MAIVALQLTIGEYAKWRQGFEGGKAMRAGVGISNERVFRNADNPNEILMIAEAADVQRAGQVLNNPELKQRMQEAGVVGVPKPYTMNPL